MKKSSDRDRHSLRNLIDFFRGKSKYYRRMYGGPNLRTDGWKRQLRKKKSQYQFVYNNCKFINEEVIRKMM